MLMGGMDTKKHKWEKLCPVDCRRVVSEGCLELVVESLNNPIGNWVVGCGLQVLASVM